MDTGVKARRNKLRGQQRGRAVDASALEEVQNLISTFPLRKDLLIEYLHLIQDKYHQISSKHIVALAHELKLAPAEVFEVASFYHHFDVVKDNDPNIPALTIRVCDSITCEMFGANTLYKELQKFYGEKVRIQRVPCVGRCAEAPVAVVGKNPISNAKLETICDVVEISNFEPNISDYISYNTYVDNGGYQLVKRYFDSTNTSEKIIEILKGFGLTWFGWRRFSCWNKVGTC